MIDAKDQSSFISNEFYADLLVGFEVVFLSGFLCFLPDALASFKADAS
jgi:hypothetical protein